jgi:hypothetical protein
MFQADAPAGVTQWYQFQHITHYLIQIKPSRHLTIIIVHIAAICCCCCRHLVLLLLLLPLLVLQIAGKRWKVDLNSRQEAGLLISAVNLPGGVQVSSSSSSSSGNSTGIISSSSSMCRR